MSWSLLDKIRAAVDKHGLRIVRDKWGLADYNGVYYCESGECCPLGALLVDKPSVSGIYIYDLMTVIGKSSEWCSGYLDGFDDCTTPTLDELLEHDFVDGYRLGKRHAKILL